MELWADWVRSSIYLTDFLRDLDWRVDRTPDVVSVNYGDHAFAKFYRPAMETFRAQLRFMRAYLDQRPDRAAEVMTQLGFPTPYFAMVLGLQTFNRYTFELIGITQVLASHVAMVAKHHLACRRPVSIGAKVMPMIPTPAHGSFPSAHATEAYAVAEVLRALVDKHRRHYADFEKRQALLSKLAERIAVNRTVAGMHYPIDTWAGAILGRAIGQIILAKCGHERRRVHAYSYKADGERDFYDHEFARRENPDYGVKKTGDFSVTSSPVFAWLWDKAGKEFDLHDRSA
jgi:membrane-associated phospholipid phosphatase